MEQKTYLFTVETDSSRLIAYLAQAVDYGDKEAIYKVLNTKRTSNAMRILSDLDMIAFQHADDDNPETIKNTLKNAGIEVNHQ